MNIRMYNVQFGDSFLLQEENELLLVDFGSDTPQALTYAEHDIIACCQGKDLSILLTHFHKDHINGLWETSLPENVNVKQVYIPDVFAMRANTATQLDFVQLHVLSDIFSSLILQKGKVCITLFDLLKALINARSTITLLHCGTSFSFAAQDYQVLWPDFTKLKIDPRLERSVLSLLTDLHLLPDDLLSSKDHIRIPYIDKFIDRLLGTYSLALGGDMTAGALEELDSAFEELSTSLNDIVRAYDATVLQRIKDKVASMRSLGNRLSIVFQDEAKNKGSKMLMTGDIPASDLRRVLRMQKISDKYQIIKAPHHGTNSHFIPTLPLCEKILISNGTPAPAHSKWGKISYQYGGFYGSHKKCCLLCTNPRCELLQWPHTSRCSACVSTSRDYIDVSLL